MTRTLLLLRHGKSDWDVGAANDYARPLKQRGHFSAQRMGAWLYEHDYSRPNLIRSGALRARTTAELVASELGAHCTSTTACTKPHPTQYWRCVVNATARGVY